MTKVKNIAILGAGESGLGAAMLGRKLGMEVLVSDAGKIKETRKQELIKMGAAFEEGKHSKEAIFNADLIIKSPGIPNKVALIQELKSAGKSVVSEIEFAYAAEPTSRIIAITGSNGKTTTTSLIHHVLTEGGVDAGLGGNIGKSFARILTEEKKEVYVLELSSFQLDDIKTFRPEIAILLNITPDHLDRYNYDLSQYAHAKFQIGSKQQEEDHFIYNLDDNVSLGEINKHKLAGTKHAFASDSKEGANAWLEGKEAVLKNGQRFDLSHMNIQGKHNHMNALVAIMVAQMFSLSSASIQKALNSFAPIAHRMEVVPTQDGKTWVNDSKATNVDAVTYALDAVKAPTVWIAGGLDKGNEYELLDVSRVKSLIILGPNKDKLNAFYTGKIPQILFAKDMEETINIAAEVSEKGDTILLSPACSSFDIFENFEARGNQFRTLVMSHDVIIFEKSHMTNDQ